MGELCIFVYEAGNPNLKACFLMIILLLIFTTQFFITRSQKRSQK